LSFGLMLGLYFSGFIAFNFVWAKKIAMHKALALTMQKSSSLRRVRCQEQSKQVRYGGLLKKRTAASPRITAKMNRKRRKWRTRDCRRVCPRQAVSPKCASTARYSKRNYPTKRDYCGGCWDKSGLQQDEPHVANLEEFSSRLADRFYLCSSAP